jgi:hypothetical protein
MVNETFPSSCLPVTDTNTPLPLQRFTPALHGPPPPSPFARYFCPPTPLLHTSTPRRLIVFFLCVWCVIVGARGWVDLACGPIRSPQGFFLGRGGLRLIFSSAPDWQMTRSKTFGQQRGEFSVFRTKLLTSSVTMLLSRYRRSRRRSRMKAFPI